MSDERATILFDGECNLCLGAVAFIRRHDRVGKFNYVPLDSPEARRLLDAEDCGCDTLHLFDAAGRHDRSSAVLRIAGDLGFPWSVFKILKMVPRSLRDACYDFVARRRKRWFGRTPRQS